MANQSGGRFLVRIEDIDVSRTRESYIASIFEDLEWLGLSWEMPVLRQSQNLAAYSAAHAKLCQMQLIYPCFATRTEIAAVAKTGSVDPDGAPLYPGLHKGLSAGDVADRLAQGQKPAWRIDMARALEFVTATTGTAITIRTADRSGTCGLRLADPSRWGDAVIFRKDSPASYHLAVVVDDASQGVTTVTRGQDLEAATDLHRLLQVLLALPEPAYYHHRLITDAKGRKLSKSEHDVALRNLRSEGLSREDLLRLLDFEY